MLDGPDTDTYWDGHCAGRTERAEDIAQWLRKDTTATKV